MGSAVRYASLERFQKNHRAWLTKFAAKRVDKDLVAQLKAKITLVIEYDDEFWVTLTWTDAAGKEHAQTLMSITLHELIDLDAEHFGGDCDLSE
jgi:hypothetical protein